MLATKMREPDEHDYFRRAVRPLLAASDDLYIEPPLSARLGMLRGAVALINPIRWPEPFGLVMVEALAAATPVLVSPYGAAPEIVDHRRTGYLCCDEEEFVDAINHVSEIDRAACRSAAERRFSLQRMAHDYEQLYRRVLARSRIPGAVAVRPRHVIATRHRTRLPAR